MVVGGNFNYKEKQVQQVVDIIELLALLTATMPEMPFVIEALRRGGI